MLFAVGIVLTLVLFIGVVLLLEYLFPTKYELLATITADEWNEVKRRALMLDLGDGGTFTQEELAILKAVAHLYTPIPAPDINDYVEFDGSYDWSQPGPVKVSNSVVVVPPVPKPSQGEKY